METELVGNFTEVNDEDFNIIEEKIDEFKNNIEMEPSIEKKVNKYIKDYFKIWIKKNSGASPPFLSSKKQLGKDSDHCSGKLDK